MNEATEPQQAPTVGAPEVGARIGDGYELVRFLGAGGMGAVYEAVSPDGRHVAVKLLLDKAAAAPDSLLVKRFEQEISLTGTLDDPHIVPTLDAGIDEALGLPFMVMPLLVGLDLSQLVEKIGPIHPTVAARIIRQACRAMMHAHGQGVVHRDLKPANLFLDHAKDGKVRVRVLDFGIAKWLESSTELTQTGALLGTPHYMAPEQVLDAKSVDVRTDVWGLALCLYEALTDDVPFRDIESFAKLCIAITTERTAPTVQELAPWIDPDLATVVHGALIRDAEERCPDIASFASALNAFTLGSEELHARMLEPLPSSLRSIVADTAAIPERWERVAPTATALEPTIGDADPLLGTELGGYELLRCLGHGGMGAVYEARADDDGRVAIKVIRPEIAGTSSSARKRFAREARLVQEIDDDHVVRIHEVAADPALALPYIVMDLLQGADLAVTVRQLGPLPPKVVARLFLQACAGLGAAHALGFIHRDVKPANLFLDRRPSGEIVVKVCDFGIAKEIDDDGAAPTEGITRTGGMLGSPMYMSPEQATDAKAIDHRSDVWSLGAAMFHALCGSPPWEGEESVGKLVLAVCTKPVPDVQERAPWVDAELADLVRDAMRKDPEARIPSMDAFAERLRAFVGDDAAVKREDLRRLGRSTLARQPPRAVVAVSATSYGSGVAATVEGLPQDKSRWPWLLGAGAAAAAVLVFLVGSTNPEEAPKPQATATAAATMETMVRVDPADADVVVDGEPATTRGGLLRLEGAPGRAFEVVVRHDGRERRERVVLAAGSDVVVLALAAAPTAAPSTTAVATATAAPVRPTLAPPRPVVAPPPVEPPTTQPPTTEPPPPPPPPEPAKPQFDDEYK